MALFGAGLIGQRHYQASKTLADLSIDWVVDPGEAGRDFAKSEGISVYENSTKLLKEALPDAAILATPTTLHVEQAQELINRGVALLIEKPIAVSSSDAAELVADADKANVPILVGHHRRHNPLIQQAKSFIEAGELGAVRLIQATCWFHKPQLYFDKAPWRKRIGAGPISINLIHDVDLIRYLCGDVSSVTARSIKSSRGFDNEEAAVALLTFKSGALGSISVSDHVAAPWSWEHTAGENPVYPQTQESCYQIGGTEGSLSVPDLKLWKHKGQPDWWSAIGSVQEPREQADPLINQLSHFVDVVRREVEPLVSGNEGLESLRVVEAIQTSSNTNQSISLD